MTPEPARALRSTEINELAAALAKAQGQISNATMNRTNPHFRSKYADLAAVLDAIRKPLADNGLASIQQIELLDGMVLRTTLMHSSGQWVASEYPLPSSGRPQEIGSLLTYARRYSLTALVCTAADEDDDAYAAESQGQKVGFRRPPPKPAANPMDTPHDPQTGEIIEAPLLPGADAAAGPSESHATPAAASNRFYRQQQEDSEPQEHTKPQDESERLAGLDRLLTAAAKNGTEILKAAWVQISKEDKAVLKAALERRYKPMALEADSVGGAQS